MAYYNLHECRQITNAHFLKSQSLEMLHKTPLYPATICLRWPKIQPLYSAVAYVQYIGPTLGDYFKHKKDALHLMNVAHTLRWWYVAFLYKTALLNLFNSVVKVSYIDLVPFSNLMIDCLQRLHMVMAGRSEQKDYKIQIWLKSLTLGNGFQGGRMPQRVHWTLKREPCHSPLKRSRIK
jgi:hypothetical protein